MTLPAKRIALNRQKPPKFNTKSKLSMFDRAIKSVL